MSLRLVRLRIAGFKSFADPVEVDVAPGTTGIVGPNGCGKSNLVEALRWALGETSARRLRGDAMDDVIFAGTATRPGRTLADVMLVLDRIGGADPIAPRRARPSRGQVANDDDGPVGIEVSRRIARGEGSDYRINGRSARARDVQVLFADAGMGVQSAAFVSQGRVGALISARPSERRALIEDAAGIAGLHTRRAEAEQRLNAAAGNLSRLDDVIGGLQSRLRSLRAQARQAERYRTLGAHIRRCEAMMLWLRWRSAEADERAARTAFDAADAAVATAMLAVSAAEAGRHAAETGIPDLRKADAEAGALLQRLRQADRELDSEAKRVEAALAQLAERLAQVERDRQRERQLAADAQDALARLAREHAELDLAITADADEAKAAREAATLLSERLSDLERDLNQRTAQLAEIEANHRALDRTRTDLVRRRKEMDGRQAEIDRDRASVCLVSVDQRCQAAERDAQIAAAALHTAQSRLDEAEARLRLTSDLCDRARLSHRAADERAARLRAEVAGLAKALDAGRSAAHTPAMDALSVPAGLERPVAAVLGAGAAAAVDGRQGQMAHWRALPPIEGAMASPPGARRLTDLIDVPGPLRRAFASALLVDGGLGPEGLFERLSPGQILVTPDGASWRWDGLVTPADAPSAAAIRIEQRNRLSRIRTESEAASAVAVAAAQELKDAESEQRAATQHVAEARTAIRSAEARLSDARRTAAAIAGERAAAEARLSAIVDAANRLDGDRARLDADAARLAAAIATLPESVGLQGEIDSLKAEVKAARAEMMSLKATADVAEREAQTRRGRILALASEQKAWRERVAGTTDRLAELDARLVAATDDRTTLAGRPDEIMRQRRDLAAEIGAAEHRRRRSADALAQGDVALRAAERAVRAAEAELATARVTRARAEGTVREIGAAKLALAERVAAALDLSTDDGAGALRDAAGLGPDEQAPALHDVESRLERLIRDREAMGPVNLLAESEAAELDAQIGSVEAERDDVKAAIARLREAIAAINTEARERLTTAFQTVDQHFQTLFRRLFGGGTAHLTLVEADDPLDCGLEVHACPPGKRLSTLSLLSGGEQALTALALLFANFLTNPAPICVMDEVDAPLDDANVERLCSLIAELAQADRARFLIVTHNPLTMGRMDRLFGVTMAEQGVSRIVSVDLRDAIRLAAE